MTSLTYSALIITLAEITNHIMRMSNEYSFLVKTLVKLLKLQLIKVNKSFITIRIKILGRKYSVLQWKDKFKFLIKRMLRIRYLKKSIMNSNEFL